MGEMATQETTMPASSIAGPCPVLATDAFRPDWMSSMMFPLNVHAYTFMPRRKMIATTVNHGTARLLAEAAGG